MMLTKTIQIQRTLQLSDAFDCPLVKVVTKKSVKGTYKIRINSDVFDSIYNSHSSSNCISHGTAGTSPPKVI